MSHIPDLTEDEQRSSAQDIGHRAKVHAARTRLQSARDQADALDAIREIAGNLIGTEQVAVFNVDKERQELWLYWSFGIDPDKHSFLEVHREPNIRQVLQGQPVFCCLPPNGNLLSTEDPVSALVPIVVNGNVCAVIVLFRLFAHKPGMDAVDQDICEVLSNCSGRAVEPDRSC